jgi:hypothetical protein
MAVETIVASIATMNIEAMIATMTKGRRDLEGGGVLSNFRAVGLCSLDDTELAGFANFDAGNF